MILILFGLAGAGKTFTGKLLEKEFGWYFYDGDTDLPEDMRKAIEHAEEITEKMRDEFFKHLFESIQVLHRNHPRLVVAQTFLKEKYRVEMREKFQDVTFLLIEASENVRKKHLQGRKETTLDEEYVKKMDALFDKGVGYEMLENNEEGTKSLSHQLKSFFLR